MTCQVFSLTLTVRGVSNKHCLLTFFIIPGVAFQFSHMNITVTDYAMAMLFLKKISVIQYSLCSEIVLISLA